MKQIRMRTFETNSSSTHSIVIAVEDEFNKWIAGEYFINQDNKFITLKTALELYQKAKGNCEDFVPFDEWINTWESEIWDYDHWMEDLEQDINIFTTPGGETIKILCAYGYD